MYRVSEKEGLLFISKFLSYSKIFCWFPWSPSTLEIISIYLIDCSMRHLLKIKWNLLQVIRGCRYSVGLEHKSPFLRYPHPVVWDFWIPDTNYRIIWMNYGISSNKKKFHSGHKNFNYLLYHSHKYQGKMPWTCGIYRTW